jgi:hypothetical protein
VADGLDDQALVRLPGDEGRAEVAAGEQPGQRVHAQVAALLVGAVALEAVLGQDRPDFRLKELGRGGGHRGGFLVAARPGGAGEGEQHGQAAQQAKS